MNATIEEEAESYFQGRKTAEQVAEIIPNRVLFIGMKTNKK